MTQSLAGPGSYYTDEQRREACTHHQVTGNFTATAKALNIPDRTLRDWAKTDWWQNIAAEVHEQTKAYNIARISSIVEQALDETEDRVKNGDTVLTKDGPVQVPMKGKDVATVAAIMIDKRQILLNQPTSIRGEANQGMEALANQFKELAQRMDQKIVSDQ